MTLLSLLFPICCCFAADTAFGTRENLALWGSSFDEDFASLLSFGAFLSFLEMANYLF